MIKPYETFKESKERAIGFIPSSWNITSIKNVLEIPITDGPHTTPKFYDHGIPFLSAESIKGGKLDFNKKRGFISQEDFEIYSQKYAPKKGDIFMVKSGATTGNTAMVETDDVFNIWSPLAVFRAHKKKVYPKFLHFYLMSFNFKTLVEISWSYGTQQNIGMGVLSNLPISYGTMEEQTQIANYLDHKTSLIDSIIAQKEELIQKLKEQRQAIINEAVTKGLNPNAKLKDSGIEWLGEIPEHWEVIKLRYLADITTGDKDTENREDDGQYPFFVRSQTIERISTYSFDGEAILTAGDGVGVCKVWHYINGKFDYHQRVYMMHNFRKVTGIYLFNFMKENFINEVLKLSAKSTVDSLRRPMFLDFPVAVPPIDEQSSIIDLLDNKQKSIDNSLEGIISSIEILKEYRQSLISEAVTGKIDVRDWQQPTN